jgi:phage terminase Nu1 subunit (DNA packaging protein)
MILSGWKEIARHLRRGLRTVQRWDQYGLPVRRPAGRSRSAVFAISEEIDKWGAEPLERRPERKALGTYLRLHPIARIQETFSETEKLMAVLKLHTAKQQHLLGLLREESPRRRLEQPRAAPVVEIGGGSPPMGAA